VEPITSYRRASLLENPQPRLHPAAVAQVIPVKQLLLPLLLAY